VIGAANGQYQSESTRPRLLANSKDDGGWVKVAVVGKWKYVKYLRKVLPEFPITGIQGLCCRELLLLLPLVSHRYTETGTESGIRTCFE
jgi:hypothetical protein